MPKVSVVMPVYNVERFLRASIDSVLAQTYTDFELVLVDDGSPDNCPEICNQYASRYRNIVVIHKPNGGLSSARNAGVKVATGKYILFVDSDDTIDSNLMETVVSKAEETFADVTIFGIHTFLYRGSKLVFEKTGNHKAGFFGNRDEVEKNFVSMTSGSMWNHPCDKLYLREILIKNNVWANSFYDGVNEDTMFLLDLFPFVNKICILPDCFYNYYIRDNQSVVTKFIPDRYEKYYFRFIKTKALMEQMRPEYWDISFLYTLYCTFIIWAYETMFNKKCTYNLMARYKYLKNAFSIYREKAEFCNEAKLYIRGQEIYINASGTTKKVLLSILGGQYFAAWIYHVIALAKRSLQTRG